LAILLPYGACGAQPADAKTGVIPLSKTNGKSGVAKGCRVALFRYPEDVAVDPKDDKKQDKKEEPSSKSADKGNKGGKNSKSTKFGGH
jgi:hypothetical protein